MKSVLISTVLAVALAGCVSTVDDIKSAPPKPMATTNEFSTIAPPANGAIVAAVYAFEDKTGQRKPSDRLAHISTAVTQGADAYVIQALQEVGGGKWFKVVERVGLENLARERQIITQTRESVSDTTPIAPLMFAGIIIEGSIAGYDSNVLTGGTGARYLGIGPSTQYREDVVTVTMRTVSVQTGEVLASVAVTKTIVSTSTDFNVFKFIEAGTQNLEIEMGSSQNEPVSYAVKTAIEAAVIEMIKEGADKGFWAFRQ
jgi:curli production assembly/transport component CsgG